MPRRLQSRCGPSQPLRGVIASRGFAVGPAALFEIDEIAGGTKHGAGSGARKPPRSSARAPRCARASTSARAARTPAVRDIMAAHLELLEDPQLLESARSAIGAGKSAGIRLARQPAREAPRHWRPPATRVSWNAPTISQISSDRCCAHSRALREQRAEIADGSILIARDLTPSQLIDLDTARLGGIALHGGRPDLARGHPRRHAGRAHAGEPRRGSCAT